jgi:hypothetical protein
MRGLTPTIEVREVIPTTEMPSELMGVETAPVTAETTSVGSGNLCLEFAIGCLHISMQRPHLA